jgi:hypothetical protein
MKDRPLIGRMYFFLISFHFQYVSEVYPWGICGSFALEDYPEYSMAGCELECKTRYVRDQCGCNPFIMANTPDGKSDLPWVLRHSVILRTSTPGYIAERACRASRPTLGIASLRHTNQGLLPQDTSLRECVSMLFDDIAGLGKMTSPTINLWQSVIFRSEVGNVVPHHCPHCQRQTIAAWLPAFVY